MFLKLSVRPLEYGTTEKLSYFCCCYCVVCVVVPLFLAKFEFHFGLESECWLSAYSNPPIQSTTSLVQPPNQRGVRNIHILLLVCMFHSCASFTTHIQFWHNFSPAVCPFLGCSPMYLPALLHVLAAHFPSKFWHQNC